MRGSARVVALALVGLAALYGYMQMARPLAHDAPQEVEIVQGMNFREAVGLLKTEGLIRNPKLFTALGELTGLDKRLIPGRYVFPRHSSPWTVFRTLGKAEPVPWEITIFEGEGLHEIRRKLADEGLVSEEDFDRLATDKGFLSSLGVEGPSLEGYLFPDTYRLHKGLPAEEILGMMVRRLREKFDQPLRRRARAMGMTELEVLTLASIIEREAMADGERYIISGVYHNRLERGMPLQADPTAIYGVRPLSEGVTREDLKNKTPYNTYTFKGLPPGPIASPGLESIKAALYPAKVPYLYFVSNGDGTHTFSATMEEHLAAVREYKKAKRRTRR
ncbi:MAG: endolytic transglycosylase MltG [Nitrospirota bacterium]|jgi:UPF0755 protein